MLKFLGNGSCFNTKAGNNTCYYYDKEDKHMLFIDCGEGTFEKIERNHLLDGVKNVDILVTHLHSDHVGSLPSLLFFCQYALGIKPTVIYPDKETIGEYLKLSGNEPDEFKIVCPNEYEKFSVIDIEQEHSKFIKAYGYLLNIDGKTIYYSGDAHTINPLVLERFNNGQIDYFYQDVTRYENFAHMNIDALNEIILPQYKDKVICMHFDDDIIKEKTERLGFKCATVEKNGHLMDRD